MTDVRLDANVARVIARVLRMDDVDVPVLRAFHGVLADILVTASDADEAPSDAQIRRAICAQLGAEGGVSSALINFSVKDGQVEIRGAITREHDRETLLAIARTVYGVKKMHNHLVWTDRATHVSCRRPKIPVQADAISLGKGDKVHVDSVPLIGCLADLRCVGRAGKRAIVAIGIVRPSQRSKCRGAHRDRRWRMSLKTCGERACRDTKGDPNIGTASDAVGTDAQHKTVDALQSLRAGEIDASSHQSPTQAVSLEIGTHENGEFADLVRAVRMQTHDAHDFAGRWFEREEGHRSGGDMIWDFKQRLYRSQKKLPPSAITDIGEPAVQRKLQAHFACVATFAAKMRSVREHVAQSKKLSYKYQKEAWLLDALEIHCVAVSSLFAEAELQRPSSAGFAGLLGYLVDYVDSTGFRELSGDITSLEAQLASIRYDLLIDWGAVTVTRYNEEPDYEAENPGRF